MSSVLLNPPSPSPTKGIRSLSVSQSPGSSNTELDERVVAKAALEAAEDALESLCAVHAGTFVAVEKRGQRVEQALQDLQATLTKAQQTVERAQNDVWRAQAEEDDDNKKDSASHSLVVLSEKHRVRRRTLLQHSALLELLELPSLMDACVRSDLYEEALSIASLANVLETQHSTPATSNPQTASTSSRKVVHHVVSQIRGRQDDLRRHLLHRLEGSVTMPDCLEVVTALRRLNSIHLELTSSASPQQEDTAESERVYRAMEVKLQIEFLEARDAWLDSATTAATGTTTVGGSNRYASSGSTATAASSSEDLLDTIERYRTRVFEIATQFNAIFRANAGGDNTTSVTSSADLLSLWTCRRIQTFLNLLERELSAAAVAADAVTPAGVATGTTGTTTTSTANNPSTTSQFGAATLRDLLEATLFFASSMGRLGADFTAHRIPTLFEDALVDWIVQHCWVQQGVKPLQDVLTLCHQVNVHTPLIAGSSRSGSASSMMNPLWSNPSSQELIQLFQDFIVPSQDEAHKLLEQPIGPLRVLMQVPPLGRFVNAILLGLNELRRCLLPSTLPRLQHALETQVLHVLSADLKALERQLITTPGKDKWLREVISSEYVPLWHRIVVPFCRASLWTSVGRAQLAWQEYHAARDAIDQHIATKQAAETQKLEEEQAKAQAAAAQAAEDDGGVEDNKKDEPEADETEGTAKDTTTLEGGEEEEEGEKAAGGEVTE